MASADELSADQSLDGRSFTALSSTFSVKQLLTVVCSVICAAVSLGAVFPVRSVDAVRGSAGSHASWCLPTSETAYRVWRLGLEAASRLLP